jgi:hypothetical protein
MEVSTTYTVNMPCGFVIDGDMKKVLLVERLHKKKCEICVKCKTVKNKYSPITQIQAGVWSSKRGNIIKA